MKPFRNGSHHYLICLVGIFKGKSDLISIIAGTDRQWPLLCNVMGRPESADDSRFNAHMGRVENAEEIKRMVQTWQDAMPSDEAVYSALEEHRVPHAPVLSVEAAMRHPHLRAREIVRTVNDRFLGEIQIPGFPLRFSEFLRHLDLEAPTLGEHNGVILRDLLGWPAARITDLETGGILHHALH